MIETMQAIVLRPTPFQDGGLVVSFLTEHGERKVGLAKGAKKPSAKWVSSFEPLSLVRVGFFGREHAELRRITRCELQHSPLTLGQLDSNLVMACLADVFDRVAKEGVEDARLFRLLSACGRALKDRPDRALSILAYAEHWLLHCLGVLPHPRACGRCGDGSEPIIILSDDHGWLCAACTSVDPANGLPLGVREHLRTLRTCSPEDAPDLGNEAARVTTNLLRARLLKELGSTLRSYEVMQRMVL